MIRTPTFWFSTSWASRFITLVLKPLAYAYAYLAQRKYASVTATKVSVPVICVGNIVAGGAGKTPFVLWLVDQLIAVGKTPHVILRGYGGSQKHTHRVGENDTVQTVGDEALLYAKLVPTWVGGDRVASAKKAVQNGAELILMDDGFQNPGLFKDLSFLIVDRTTGLGNGQVLPAGPLREPAKAALKRCDCLILMGQVLMGGSSASVKDLPSLLSSFKGPTFDGQVLIQQTDLDWLVGKDLIAFSGIGRPQKFFDSLERSNANVITCESYADHHVFTETELRSLLDLQTKNPNAQLVTTSKDYVRLPAHFQDRVRPVGADFTSTSDADILRLILNLVLKKK